MLPARIGAIAAVALTLILSTAAPAHAHGEDAPDATNYRSSITQTPGLPGLEIITIEAGARLQLTNHSGRNVEVLGYQGEPYLEIRPDGVYENIHSPAKYLNVTIMHVDPPAHADPTRAPEWAKIADGPRYRWHDQRALWTRPQPPDFVVADPGKPHHIRDWTVPMRAGTAPLALKGTLTWEPPPQPWLWWGLALGGAGLVALLGLVRIKRILPVITLAAAGLALTYGVGRERDAGNFTFGEILGQLFTAQLWPTVTALAAVAASVYALVRREGDFAIALGGAAVALFSGMVNAAVFHRSVTPVPWDPILARVIITLVIVLGGGAALAAMVRMRGTAPTSS